MSEKVLSVGAHRSLSTCILSKFDVHHCPVQQAVRNTSAPASELQCCSVQKCYKPKVEFFTANPADPTS